MRKCIVVMGMHRSGTSAMTGLLNILGVELGSRLMKPLEANPKGYFENQDIYEINEKILGALGSSWDNVFLEGDIGDDKSSCTATHEAELKDIMVREFFDSKIFAVKDPRISILLPIWQRVLASLDILPSYIICIRHPLEAAESLRERDGFSIEKGLLLWMKYMLASEYYSRKSKRVFVSFDCLLMDPRKTVGHIQEVLEVKLYRDWEEEKRRIELVLEPGVKHHSHSRGQERSDNLLLDLILRFYGILSDLAAFGHRDDGAQGRMDGIREDYSQLCCMFYHKDFQDLIGPGMSSRKADVEKRMSEEIERLKRELDAREEIIEELRGIRDAMMRSKAWKVSEFLSRAIFGKNLAGKKYARR